MIDDQSSINQQLPLQQGSSDTFRRAFFESITIKMGFAITVLVSVVVGLLVVFYSYTQSQSSLLTEIRDKHYPVQSQMQAALLHLKMIQVNMEDAVLTAERESLNQAEQLREDFETALAKALNLDPNMASRIAQIERAFLQYYLLSHNFAETLIANPESENYEIGEQSYERYTRLVSQLEKFQENEIESFSEAIDYLSKKASTFVSIGVPIILGFMTMVLIIVVTTSRNIIRRVSNIVDVARQIAIQDGDMNQRIYFAGRDEMAELAFWFNRFIDKLQSVSEESTKEIRKFAYTDTLSGLPNRRLFNIRLQTEIKRADITNTQLAVIFLDLDNFKIVNDQLGHEAGDTLLREVSERLDKSLRSQDIISRGTSTDNDSMVARMGGDEFMVIIPKVSQKEQVSAIAERIRKQVLKPLMIEGKIIEIGVSMGIAIYPEDASSVDQLVVNADLAMYDAKKAGKNRFSFFHKSLGERAAFENEIEQRLKTALREDPDEEIHFYFQPKYDMRSGKINGAEALMRWRNSHLGNVSPDRFIPVLEAGNLILELDRLAIFSVCHQMKLWRESNNCVVPVGINISARQASTPTLVDIVKEALEVNDIPPSLIELEITETSALSDLNAVAKNIRQLKAMSVKVALDDFGAGHASLSLMAHCEVDTLKIDREFVSASHKNESSYTVIRGIIKLAKALNVTTVGEGIETKEQFQALLDMGCDVGQGYLMSKPLAANEFIQLLNPMS